MYYIADAMEQLHEGHGRQIEEKIKEIARRRANSEPLPTISNALDRAAKLGAVATLRTMPFWRANIRATNGHVQYADEILKAEAWLTANPTRAPRKDLARFLHNWLARAGERG